MVAYALTAAAKVGRRSVSAMLVIIGLAAPAARYRATPAATSAGFPMAQRSSMNASLIASRWAPALAAAS